ncbi:MAG: hypothetical protein NC420_04325 [Eubacterium sp.]|nr:hypothetical protein [Eubacterium sp.]MCM1216175.1 hypothetical protein [Lachnospiraceae bacterium]MCM1239054.1 hypothetical protein [Lachnospiraceae bacterium]
MNREIEYRNAYEMKKEPEGVYIMNQFCSGIEKEATVEDIPDIMRLYYDRALTCEQNEFVTEVICKIVENNPRDAARNIIAHIRILQEEKAEECFLEIMRIFIYWYPQFKNIFMEELKESDIENQKYVLDIIEYWAEERNEEEYIDFLKEYKL